MSPNLVEVELESLVHGRDRVCEDPPPQNYPSLLIDAMRERDDSVNVVPPAKVWYQEHGRMSAKAVCSIS